MNEITVSLFCFSFFKRLKLIYRTISDNVKTINEEERWDDVCF
jgi:hypothetical protein